MGPKKRRKGGLVKWAESTKGSPHETLNRFNLSKEAKMLKRDFIETEITGMISETAMDKGNENGDRRRIEALKARLMEIDPDTYDELKAEEFAGSLIGLADELEERFPGVTFCLYRSICPKCFRPMSFVTLYVFRPKWTNSSRVSLRSDAGPGSGCWG